MAMLEKSAILIGLICKRYAKNITTGALLSEGKADYYILWSVPKAKKEE